MQTLGRRQRRDSSLLGKDRPGLVTARAELRGRLVDTDRFGSSAAVPMSNPPFQQSKADSSRSTLNEPGPRGSQQQLSAAARPRQCYYRRVRSAFAAERLRVRRTEDLDE